MTAILELRWSCAICARPDQPIVRTKQGRAAICPDCLAIVEPEAIHPNACTCGRGHKPGILCSDENFTEER